MEYLRQIDTEAHLCEFGLSLDNQRYLRELLSVFFSDTIGYRAALCAIFYDSKHLFSASRNEQESAMLTTQLGYGGSVDNLAEKLNQLDTNFVDFGLPENMKIPTHGS